MARWRKHAGPTTAPYPPAGHIAGSVHFYSHPVLKTGISSDQAARIRQHGLYYQSSHHRARSQRVPSGPSEAVIERTGGLETSRGAPLLKAGMRRIVMLIPLFLRLILISHSLRRSILGLQSTARPATGPPNEYGALQCCDCRFPPGLVSSPLPP